MSKEIKVSVTAADYLGINLNKKLVISNAELVAGNLLVPDFIMDRDANEISKDNEDMLSRGNDNEDGMIV